MSLTAERACPLCGRGNVPYETEAKVVGSMELALGLNICGECGLHYISPALNSEGLSRLYRNYECTVSRRYNADDQVARAEYDQFEGYIRTCLPQGGRILDIGCGTGNFLARFVGETEYETIGIEVAQYPAEAARAKGINVEIGGIEDLAHAAESYDAITMWYVLEHVEKPIQVLLEARKLLKPTGLLLVAVPNYHYMRIIHTGCVGKMLFGQSTLYPEEHLQNFSKDTLSKILLSCDFVPIRWECASVMNEGSMLVRAGKKIAALSFGFFSSLGLIIGGIHCIASPNRGKG